LSVASGETPASHAPRLGLSDSLCK
jgi:hypothetical protein